MRVLTIMLIYILAYVLTTPPPVHTVQSGNATDIATTGGIVTDSTTNLKIMTGHHYIISTPVVLNRIEFQTGSFLDYQAGGSLRLKNL